ncbi:hypothetical protein EJ06DRAFT_243633 [Trichodelitschia bisporula]|uniref:Uncharacterized protein n=1 Tax=Trichodelitschia bisporula TaxID=703511 RepID=A0A6G1HJB3_9PEZI|nr:hypothetical protein EJ06DRAFT_243633 [Trichodelitschia bisporula]
MPVNIPLGSNAVAVAADIRASPRPALHTAPCRPARKTGRHKRTTHVSAAPTVAARRRRCSNAETSASTVTNYHIHPTPLRGYHAPGLRDGDSGGCNCRTGLRYPCMLHTRGRSCYGNKRAVSRVQGRSRSVGVP